MAHVLLHTMVMENSVNHDTAYSGQTAVVDSDTDAAERLVTCLTNEDFTVDRICSINDLLTRLYTQQYDALILGIEAHGMKCYELLPLIREIDDQLPVIVTSSDDSLEVAARVREQGVFYYVLKPVDIAEIKMVLRNALQRRSLRLQKQKRSDSKNKE